MNSFDYSIYQNEFPEIEENLPEKRFDYSQYLETPEEKKLPQVQEKSFLRKVGETALEGARVTGQLGARGVEGALGTPGEMLRGLANLTIWGAEKIGGREISPKFKEIFFQTAPFKLLPTIAQVREKGKELTGGVLEPKNSAEEIAGDVVELGTALATPSNPRSGFKFVKDLGKAYKIATAGTAAKQTVKSLKGSESDQALAEAGTMFATALFNPKAVLNYANDLRQTALKAVPKGQTIKVPNLIKGLDTVEKELQFGDMTPTKEAVLKSVTRLKEKISSGKADPTELMQFYKDINEKLNAKNLFEYLGFGDKQSKQLLKQRFDKLRDQIRDTIEDYGKINPKASESWLASNDVYNTYFKSKEISQWLRDKAKFSLPPGLLHLAMHPQNIPSAAIGAGLATAASKGLELIYRLKNPKIRQLYLDIFKNAANKNAPAMNRSLKFLNEELENNQGEET